MALPVATSIGLASLVRPCNARHVAATRSPNRDAQHGPILLSPRGQMVTMPGAKLPGCDDHALICLFVPHYRSGTTSVTAATASDGSHVRRPPVSWRPLWRIGRRSIV